MVFTHPLNAPHPTATTHIRHQLWRTRKMAHSLVLLLRSTSLPDDLLLLFARTSGMSPHTNTPPTACTQPTILLPNARSLPVSLSLSLDLPTEHDH